MRCRFFISSYCFAYLDRQRTLCHWRTCLIWLFSKGLVRGTQSVEFDRFTKFVAQLVVVSLVFSPFVVIVPFYYITKPPFDISLGAVDLNTKLRRILNGRNLTHCLLGSLKLYIKWGKTNRRTLNGISMCYTALLRL
jgi:hypothetical protein